MCALCGSCPSGSPHILSKPSFPMYFPGIFLPATPAGFLSAGFRVASWSWHLHPGSIYTPPFPAGDHLPVPGTRGLHVTQWSLFPGSWIQLSHLPIFSLVLLVPLCLAGLKCWNNPASLWLHWLPFFFVSLLLLCEEFQLVAYGCLLKEVLFHSPHVWRNTQQ